MMFWYEYGSLYFDKIFIKHFILTSKSCSAYLDLYNQFHLSSWNAMKCLREKGSKCINWPGVCYCNTAFIMLPIHIVAEYQYKVFPVTGIYSYCSWFVYAFFSSISALWISHHKNGEITPGFSLPHDLRLGLCKFRP